MISNLEYRLAFCSYVLLVILFSRNTLVQISSTLEQHLQQYFLRELDQITPGDESDFFGECYVYYKLTNCQLSYSSNFDLIVF